jgi:hypothetical protein
MANLTQPVRKRLLLSKKFVEHGRDHAQASGEFNRILAIHHLHIAVEVFVKCTLFHLGSDTEKEPSQGFDSLLKTLSKSKAFQQERWHIRERQALRDLNQLRNVAQHSGNPPDSKALEDLEYQVGRFLKESSREWFGLDFSELGETDFVEDERLRSLLETAESLLDAQGFDESIATSKAAFDFASDAVLHELSPERSRLGLTTFGKFRELERATEELLKHVHDAEVALAIVATGMELRDFRRFRQIPVWAIRVADGGCSLQTGHGPERTEDDSRFALRFVLDCVLKWQDLGFAVGVSDWRTEGYDRTANGLTEMIDEVAGRADKGDET